MTDHRSDSMPITVARRMKAPSGVFAVSVFAVSVMREGRPRIGRLARGLHQELVKFRDNEWWRSPPGPAVVPHLHIGSSSPLATRWRFCMTDDLSRLSRMRRTGRLWQTKLIE
jgi:hypothetical protein